MPVFTSPERAFLYAKAFEMPLRHFVLSNTEDATSVLSTIQITNESFSGESGFIALNPHPPDKKNDKAVLCFSFTEFIARLENQSQKGPKSSDSK